ncbi:hypothetical protein MN202_15890 [Rheinheimera muenzenbergensis]|uniref:Amino acid permease n=1 Tax=Rheinheimera muenzenbergensis TaxID=1193628 RepID=A0ABU8C9Y7_9GAMM
MLPSKLYEALPYVYIGTGVAVLLNYGNWLAVVCALLLTLAGAVIWILRSDNRRSDVKGARYKYGGKLPFWYYEMLPFLCVMSALFVFSVSKNMYFYPFAMMLLGVGTHLWLLRGSYRKHQRPQQKLQPLKYHQR